MQIINIKSYKITIFDESTQNNIPLVILNTVKDEGQEVYKCCKELNCSDFILVTIFQLNWNDDLSPYPYEDKYMYFKGNSKTYLNFIENEVLVQVHQLINKKISHYILAGYSLAGLFALYSLYQTNLFDALAIASGSFWYPHFLEYVKNNKCLKLPHSLYFSLGHKEKNTRNKMMKKVEDNTISLVEYYKNLGVNTFYEVNQGNHFYQVEQRMAKAISWVLKQ